MYIYICTHTNTLYFIYVYIYMDMYTYIHTYMYTHTHIKYKVNPALAGQGISCFPGWHSHAPSDMLFEQLWVSPTTAELMVSVSNVGRSPSESGHHSSEDLHDLMNDDLY